MRFENYSSQMIRKNHISNEIVMKMWFEELWLESIEVDVREETWNHYIGFISELQSYR